MPIEPVANQIRPVQAPDMMEGLANALRIRGAMNEQQLFPERMKAMQSENAARAVETKVRQRGLDAASAIAGAFQKHTTIGDDGSIAVDHGGVMKDLTDNGWGPEALKVDADRRANLKAAYDQEEALTKLNATKASRMGALAGSVVSAINNAGDDDAKKKAAYELAIPQAVQTALSEKLLQPEQADAILKHPYGTDVVNQFQNWANGAMSYKDQLDSFNSHLRESREQVLAGDTHTKNVAELPEVQAKALGASVEQAGRTLANAAAQGPAAYSDAWYAEQGKNPDVSSQFPHPSTYDPKTTAGLVRQAALKPYEATQATEAAKRDANTDAYRRSTEAFRNARLAWDQDKFAQTNANGGKPMTAGQRKVEERNIFNEENGTTTRPGLNAQRLRIGNVLSSGKNTDGTALTPEKRADIQAQYEGATNALQAIQFRKAELYGVPKPGQQAVTDMKDGEAIDTGDGHTWKKQGSVVFYQGQGGATSLATPPPPAAPPASTAPPATAGQPKSTAAAAAASPQVGARFSNGKITVKWDGSNWIDEKTGKPAQF